MPHSNHSIMKGIRMLMLSTAAWFQSTPTIRADLILRSERAGEELQLMFDSHAGTNYQFQVSTNLSHWENLGPVIPGDDLTITQAVSMNDRGATFFRLEASQGTVGISPSEAEFTSLVVGKTILRYAFLSSTRFSWLGESGRWKYAKTGISTGELVFTYDEDGNDPAVYREEIVMTFQSSTQATYRYSAFYSDVEYSPSVSTGEFNLGSLKTQSNQRIEPQGQKQFPISSCRPHRADRADLCRRRDLRIAANAGGVIQL